MKRGNLDPVTRRGNQIARMRELDLDVPGREGRWGKDGRWDEMDEVRNLPLTLFRTFRRRLR